MLAYEQIYAYSCAMPRRKPGALLPLELTILDVAMSLRSQKIEEFHGFAIAQAIQAQTGATLLTAHGTLYRALSRMQRDGLLESNWEDPEIAESQSRPRRRLYQVTGQGELAATRAHREQPSGITATRLATS